ncbi:DUF5074 domain-containing protein [Chitinophaga sp. 22321]|uniref:DUF5074 domain-containing protein n=2 Tax=Chitinophagaceae TaxID=563835 RepID=A0ABS5JA61_9BACT|nr:DUF5074 domain-containing protein [Chitinophaga hostae]MBS0032101.1 DUF5074 domain-containing protein [Chitinophaga hostae]
MRLSGSMLFIAAVLTMAMSCKKNDDVIPGPGVDKTGGTDTLRIGAAVSYHPKIANPAGATFTWKVNGAVVGNESAYTFTASARGDYHIVFTAGNAATVDSVIYQVKVWGKYENGFFVVQEGQYGATGGDLFYYSYDSNKIAYDVFKTENPGKDFGPPTSTLQFATIYNGKIYMSVKVGGPLVVADAYSMKETGRIDHLPQDEGHAFTGIDNTRGLLSAVDGVYRVNLAGPAIGAKIDGINSAAGDMMVAGEYVFVLTEGDGIVVLKTSDYSIVKKYPKGTMGFARTKDGAVWAAGDSALVRIDPVSLAVTETKVPFKVTNPWALWAWRSGSITASASGNDVYIAERKDGPGIGGTIEYSGTKIYKYTPGNAASFAAPFITIPGDQYFYGSAVRFNERTKELVVLTLTDEWGSSNDNRWLFYDAATGALKQTVRYPGYYFSALPVFY